VSVVILQKKLELKLQVVQTLLKLRGMNGFANRVLLQLYVQTLVMRLKLFILIMAFLG